MRRLILFILTVITTGCLILAADTWFQTKTIATEKKIQTGIAEEVIRFHVRANSDSTNDQQIKMQVKSAVLEYLQPLLKDAKDVQDVTQILEGSLNKIKQVAERTQWKAAHAKVCVELRQEYFPEKTYGDCTFPAGNYQALVIELGEGAGHNWWCMLYPSLCFVDECYAVVPDEGKKVLEAELSELEYEWVTKNGQRKYTFLCNGWKELFDCVKIGISF